MEIKDTLTMPKTGFEMRGNLPNKEPKFLDRWQSEDLYSKMMRYAKRTSPIRSAENSPHTS